MSNTDPYATPVSEDIEFNMTGVDSQAPAAGNKYLGKGIYLLSVDSWETGKAKTGTKFLKVTLKAVSFSGNVIDDEDQVGKTSTHVSWLTDNTMKYFRWTLETLGASFAKDTNGNEKANTLTMQDKLVIGEVDFSTNADGSPSKYPSVLKLQAVTPDVMDLYKKENNIK